MRLIQVYSIKTNLLKVDDAFAFSATLSTDKSQLQAHWDIADGYYLYQDKINAELVGKSNSLSLHTQQAAELHQDPYFGEVQVLLTQLMEYLAEHLIMLMIRLKSLIKDVPKVLLSA